MLLTILAFLCGIVLSLRFDVLILLPATLLGWFLMAGSGLVGGSSGMSIVMWMLFVSTALQVGYVAGICGQWVLASMRLTETKAWRKQDVVAPDHA
jgi:hypothetical protein